MVGRFNGGEVRKAPVKKLTFSLKSKPGVNVVQTVRGGLHVYDYQLRLWPKQLPLKPPLDGLDSDPHFRKLQMEQWPQGWNERKEQLLEPCDAPEELASRQDSEPYVMGQNVELHPEYQPLEPYFSSEDQPLEPYCSLEDESLEPYFNVGDQTLEPYVCSFEEQPLEPYFSLEDHPLETYCSLEDVFLEPYFNVGDQTLKPYVSLGDEPLEPVCSFCDFSLPDHESLESYAQDLPLVIYLQEFLVKFSQDENAFCHDESAFCHDENAKLIEWNC